MRAKPAVVLSFSCLLSFERDVLAGFRRHLQEQFLRLPIRIEEIAEYFENNMARRFGAASFEYLLCAAVELERE